MRPAFDLSVYLVTDPVLNGGRLVEAVVAEAVRGGATMVQLRDPVSGTREMVDLARALVGLLRPLSVPLIVNDRVDVALAADADGVHVGQGDMDARDVRRLIGPEKIVGLSVADRAELEASRAALDTVDYLGVGSVFSTSTKPDVASIVGVEGIAWIRAATDLPLVGIGGIDSARTAEVVAAGAEGVAVVSAIMTAEDPAQAAAEIVLAVQSGKKARRSGIQKAK